MNITVNNIQFSGVREFMSFLDKLKQFDRTAYDKFLDVSDEPIEPLTQEKIVRIRSEYVRYNGYTPVFWFQTNQSKAIPVYNKGFRPDVNSRFIREFSVPHRGSNTLTPIRLYYNFVAEQRYAVMV